jgi:mRNA deadenylase 3'-5' endonuclease subunit Ccr4
MKYIKVTHYFTETLLYVTQMRGRVLMFNAIFNNISAISWWSLLLVGKTEYPEKTTDLLQVTDRPAKVWYPCMA